MAFPNPCRTHENRSRATDASVSAGLPVAGRHRGSAGGGPTGGLRGKPRLPGHRFGRISRALERNCRAGIGDLGWKVRQRPDRRPGCLASPGCGARKRARSALRLLPDRNRGSRQASGHMAARNLQHVRGQRKVLDQSGDNHLCRRDIQGLAQTPDGAQRCGLHTCVQAASGGNRPSVGDSASQARPAWRIQTRCCEHRTTRARCGASTFPQCAASRLVAACPRRSARCLVATFSSSTARSGASA